MARLSSPPVQRQMAQDCHILCAMAFAKTTLVCPQADIKDPLERLFYTPVVPDGLSKTHGIAGKRSQNIALLARDVTSSFEMGRDQTTAGDLRPRTLDA
jgi:hypothetical protein